MGNRTGKFRACDKETGSARRGQKGRDIRQKYTDIDREMWQSLREVCTTMLLYTSFSIRWKKFEFIEERLWGKTKTWREGQR